MDRIETMTRMNCTINRHINCISVNFNPQALQVTVNKRYWLRIINVMRQNVQC